MSVNLISDLRTPVVIFFEQVETETDHDPIIETRESSHTSFFFDNISISVYPGLGEVRPPSATIHLTPQRVSFLREPSELNKFKPHLTELITKLTEVWKMVVFVEYFSPHERTPLDIIDPKFSKTYTRLDDSPSLPLGYTHFLESIRPITN